MWLVRGSEQHCVGSLQLVLTFKSSQEPRWSWQFQPDSVSPTKQLPGLSPSPGLRWCTETRGLNCVLELEGILKKNKQQKSGIEAALRWVTFAPAVVMSGLLVIAVTGGCGGGGGGGHHPVRSQGSN